MTKSRRASGITNGGTIHSIKRNRDNRRSLSWREHTLLSVTDGCLLEAGDGKSLRFRSGNSER